VKLERQVIPMDYTIEDKIYAFCHLKAEERAQEKHLLDAAADLFMRTVPKIDPEHGNMTMTLPPGFV
jgi:hypothetical protein